MTAPWFKDGLRFGCTRCGTCCTGEPGFVWVNDEEVQIIADRLGEPVEQFRAMFCKTAKRGVSLREKLNGDCIFFDRAAGCTIYDIRPRQCRTWPFWESNLEDQAAWEHTCQICPGSGQGDLISVEEITNRLKVIRM